MTTSVDILFKELPAMSRGDERISRPETSSVGSDYDRDRSLVSRKNDEKSFNKHLDDHEISNERLTRNDHAYNNVPVRTNDDTSNDRSSTINKNDTTSEGKTNQINAQEKSINADGSQRKTNPEENFAVSVNNKTEEKVPRYTTKDLLLTETTAEKSALQNNAYTVQNTIKAAAGNVLDQNTVNGSSPKNTPDQSSGQQFEQNLPSQNAAQTVSTQMSDAAAKQAPLFTVAVDAQSSENSQSKPAINVNNIDSGKPASLRDISPIDRRPQAIQNEFAVDSQKTVGTAAKLAEENVNPEAGNIGAAKSKLSETISEQKPSAPTNKKALSPLAEEPISIEVGSTISAMASALNKEIANADLLQKPVARAETVAVGSAKTLPFAVIQSPNSAQKTSSNTKKSGSTVSATNNNNNTQFASNNAAQGAAQNTISQAMLQNAQKSDIQIDLGFGGQKFDAPLGQLTTPSGQPSLSTGSMIAAQDVSFQKTLSAAATNKSDIPMNAKMINEQITVAINKNVVKGLNNFSIRLHPAELGQVDIKLEFAADGKMHAAMMVESEKTLTMLQRDQTSLEKALQDAGINLSNKEMNFSLMKQNQENNANKFIGMTGSPQIDGEIDELTKIGSMQDIRMAYSNQTLDISV